MPRWSNRLYLRACRQWRFSTSRPGQAVRSAQDVVYRRTFVEQLEIRCALDGASVAAGLPAQDNNAGSRQIEAATFSASPFNYGLSLVADNVGGTALVRPANEQKPLFVLSPLDQRPIAASIDRIQATASVETYVEIEQKRGAPPARGVPNDAIGTVGRVVQAPPKSVVSHSMARPSTATPVVPQQESLQRHRHVPTTPEVATPAGVADASVGVEPKARRIDPFQSESPRRDIAAAPVSTPGKSEAIVVRPVSSPSLKSSPAASSAFPVSTSNFSRPAPARMSSAPQATSSSDGREYLSSVQSTLFIAAAAATALALPGIVAEIRRRRKKQLQRITPLAPIRRVEKRADQEPQSLPMRERAG